MGRLRFDLLKNDLARRRSRSMKHSSSKLYSTDLGLSIITHAVDAADLQQSIYVTTALRQIWIEAISPKRLNTMNRTEQNRTEQSLQHVFPHTTSPSYSHRPRVLFRTALKPLTCACYLSWETFPVRASGVTSRRAGWSEHRSVESMSAARNLAGRELIDQIHERW